MRGPAEEWWDWCVPWQGDSKVGGPQRAMEVGPDPETTALGLPCSFSGRVARAHTHTHTPPTPLLLASVPLLPHCTHGLTSIPVAGPLAPGAWLLPPPPTSSSLPVPKDLFCDT